MQFSNLGLRFLSAFALLTLGLSSIILNLTSRWIAISLIVVLGAWELARMVNQKFASPHFEWLTTLSVLAFCLPYFPHIALPENWLWWVTIITLLSYVVLAFGYLSIEQMAPWLFLNGFISVYMGLWSTKIFELEFRETGLKASGPFLLTMFCIAAADSGAYACGRLFGRRKLAPNISSKKTIEGALGGVLITMAIAALLAPPLVGINPILAALFGAVLAGSSILGDLFISALKRYCGAKDTSRIIPGHGGVMDRFDALTFSGPIAWLGFRCLGVL